jgi:transcriptional regulator with XRE-family HTH domain
LKLKDARKACGLTQEDLVDLVDISIRNYQRIEYGQIMPPVNKALKICLLLNVDPYCIDEWKSNDTSDSPSSAE